MNPSTRQFYEFGPFRLDTVKRLLLRDAAPVAITSKAFDTLLALVQHGGEILEKEYLLNRVWPDTIVEEKNLTVTISSLRKALGESPHQHQFIVTVPGRGYKFVASVREVAGGESALTITEQTSQRIVIEREAADHRLRRTSEQFDLPAVSRARRWRTITATIALGLLSVGLIAVGYWLVPSRSHQSQTPLPIKSCAVLPFKPLSADRDDEYMGLGMTDALITRLSNISQIIVRPMRSVRKYSETETDPILAGQELKVDAVLEGSIQRSGDRVRVTARLMSVKDSKPIWGETFDEKFTDVFTVEDSISQRLVRALALQLSDEEMKRLTKRYTDNAEAYQLYLKGRYYSRTWTREGFKKALENFHQAIAIDPTYALAHAGLSDAYYRESTVHLALQVAVPKAKAEATEALRLDDSLAEAHTSLAAIKFRYDWDFPAAESEFKRAIELNPNYVTAHEWYSEYLTAMGRVDESVAEAKLAQRIDPVSPEVGWDLGLALLFGRRYDEAVEELGQAVELDDRFWLTHEFLGWAYEEKGEFEKALAEYEKARSLDDNADILSQLVAIYVKVGRRSDAQRVAEELIRRSKQEYVSPFYLAAAYVAMGNNDEGIRWLQKAYEERAELLVFIKVAPNFDGLRSDPRFLDLIRHLGLAQ